MNCQICGGPLQTVDNNLYCPNCKIFTGNQSSTPQKDTADKTENIGKVFQQRNRKNSIKKIFFLGLFFLIFGTIIYLFIMNFTSIGYREKIFEKYSFTPEARSYLRGKTKIEIAFLNTKNPVGLTHSGVWYPGNSTVRLNSANDEVAIHEFAHAWWEEQRKDLNWKKSLIADTIELSKMNDANYYPSIKRAGEIVDKYCSCSDGIPNDLSRVDDHHFYAPMAEFTMGNFKNGLHQLPEFMWKYFDSLFVGETKLQACYVDKTCSFPVNNY